ncbi:D-Ala-D-Ala carboxypeptidase family metallohydrolase [Hallella bergensis]|uniref:D-Ala-D-Ala carboxypeptidase family metallohydrolase n=1 Tax=Hallella bergensis TaxID=242750 RepID=UPI0039909867
MTKQEKLHLSDHFTLYELTRSGTAIDHDLPNVPNLQQEQALRNLALNILEPLRRQFGPVIVSSGFRTRQVNRLVGGAPASQHTRGEAADIVINNTDRGLRMYSFIKTRLDFDQLILEPIGSPTPRWLHVSYTTRRRNRQMTL